MKKVHKTLILIFAILLILFFIRLASPREIDDVAPGIFCEHQYLAKADILWVIPNYNNQPVSENKTWCEEILALNKTLGLHGVNHTYKEFNNQISEGDLDKSFQIFRECFNQTPTLFKPPQLAISNANKQLIKTNNLKRRGIFNQITHKVYHCSDTGQLPNWFIDLF